jgi:hypothetical protein
MALRQILKNSAFKLYLKILKPLNAIDAFRSQNILHPQGLQNVSSTFFVALRTPTHLTPKGITAAKGLRKKTSRLSPRNKRKQILFLFNSQYQCRVKIQSL